MKIFPFYCEAKNTIEDGALYKAHNFCRKLSDNNKCKNFYLSIAKNVGFHICPYGFTAYVLNEDSPILTSLKINQLYDRKKTKGKESLFPEKLEKDIFLEYIEHLTNNVQNTKLLFMEEMLHDLRKFSKSLNRKSDHILTEIVDKSHPPKISILQNDIFDMYIITRFLSLTITRLDKKLNPSLGVDINTDIPIPIYKRFDRVRYFLNSELRRKSVKMSFYGECRIEFFMPQQVSILPFLLLDNALKYSPTNQNIDVYFEDSKDELKIKIESIGPLVKDEEREFLFDNKFQGIYAKAFSTEGEGRGLSIARDICKECNVTITLIPGTSIIFYNHDIPFAKFIIFLSFCKKTLNRL